MKNDMIRITESLTSGWEKRNLPKIAKALPQWIVPDHLTALGVFAAMIIGAGYILAYRSPSWLVLSIVGLFLHWLGDSLDGTLARVPRRERPKYGYYIDRTADAIAIVIICVSFGLSPFAKLSVGLLLAVSYLMIMVHAEVCAYTSGTFPMSIARLGPTEARIGLAIFTVALIFWSPGTIRVAGLTVTTLDLIGLAASLGLFACFASMSIVQARKLGELDPGKPAPVPPTEVEDLIDQTI